MTSLAEQTLAAQLEQAGIPFEREARFHSVRRWRFDFVVWHPYFIRGDRVGEAAIEVEGGSFSGGHRRGLRYEFDCEKHNAAMLLGWRVYRFTPAMVEDGRAFAVIQQALGLTEVAA
jgi:hypothetical protein